ncbi:MAG: hypothetical protein ABWY63_01710 [Hyphomicrobiaceae bacterium]
MTREEVDSFYRQQAPVWDQTPSETMQTHALSPAVNASPPANPVDRLRQGVTDSDWFRKLPPEAQRLITGTGDIMEYAPPVAAARGAYEGSAGLADSDYARAAVGLLDTIPELGKGLGTAVAAGVPAIRAYHGSPHSFDRFDISKIGTGEGAQAYGHGLYFAGNEDVAKAYRDNLTAARTKFSHPTYGENLDLNNADHAFMSAARKAGPSLADSRIEEIGTNLTEALRGGDDLRHMAKFIRQSDWAQDEKAAWLAALQEAERFTLHKPKGHMYEVDIRADPERFLDWDRPLNEQSPKVREALAPLGFKHDDEALRAYDDALLAALYGKGSPNLPLRSPNPTGEVLYRRIANSPERISEASMTLADQGIPGIKYLDQFSRGAGAGSSNYVVFNDQIIDLVRKYGIGGLALLGAGGYGMNQAEAAEEEQPPMQLHGIRPRGSP